MNRKYLAKVWVFALTAGIILPSTIAHGETLSSSVSTVNSNEVSYETPVIDVYDKDGNLIKNYTKEEVEKLSPSLVPNTLVGSHGNIKEEIIVTSLCLNAYIYVGQTVPRAPFTDGLNILISHLTDGSTTSPSS